MSVSAVTLIGEGPRSNPISIWAVSVPNAPSVSLTETSRDSCKIQWTAVQPPLNSLITGYIVLIDDGLDGPFKIGYNGDLNPSKLFA